jgi:nucleoside-diphosphate-sugar epimerase
MSEPLKVCITGASGFIGQYIQLQFIKNKISFFNWDRNNREDLNSCNIVLHLAGLAHRLKYDSEETIREYREVNRDLTLQLANEALKRNIKKFIFVSSVKAMGEMPGNFILSDPAVPTEPYGISKLEAEKGLVDLFSNQRYSQCIILRIPMVYGPGNKGNMMQMLRMAEKHIPLPLGSVQGKRSLIFVGNLYDAILKILQDKALTRNSLQTFFLTDGKNITSGELYNYIFQVLHGRNGVFPFPEALLQLGGKIGTRLGRLLNRQLPFNTNTISKLLTEYTFSPDAFCCDYNWTPPFSIKEGLKITTKKG